MTRALALRPALARRALPPLPPLLLALLPLALCGCPSEDPEAPPPLPVAGDYVLVAQQLDTECVGGDWDFWAIFDFMERTPSDVPSMALAVTQDGGALLATQAPAGCAFEGSVGAEGAFSLRGDCDTASMARAIAMSGTIAPFGAAFDVDGDMTIDVDRDDGAGGAPDGVVDCVVTSVRLTGSGTPAD